MNITDQLEAQRRLRWKAVCELTGYSRPTLYRRIRDGLFPAPKRDAGCAFWRAGEVLEWLRERDGAVEQGAER
jgi:predicted DNA-binding transcriptional regulator AlpA